MFGNSATMAMAGRLPKGLNRLCKNRVRRETPLLGLRLWRKFRLYLREPDVDVFRKEHTTQVHDLCRKASRSGLATLVDQRRDRGLARRTDGRRLDRGSSETAAARHQSLG